MSKVKKRIQDNDLASAEVALRRAARRARTIAEKTHIWCPLNNLPNLQFDSRKYIMVIYKK